MSEVTFVPFNNIPTLTDYGNTGRSYTCPSGKGARVVVTLSASAYGSLNDNTNGSQNSQSTSDSNAVSFEVWIKAADTIATSNSAANNAGNDNSGVGVHEYQSGTSTASCTLNGNTISSVSASVRFQYFNAGALATAWDIDGTVSAKFHVAEYNVVS